MPPATSASLSVGVIHGWIGYVHTLSTRANYASVPHNPLRRQNPRQEPYGAIPHVQICAGGGR